MAQDAKSPEYRAQAHALIELARELLRQLRVPPPTLWGRIRLWCGGRWRGDRPEAERAAAELRRLVQALIYSTSR
jgi:hypothetical protein